MFVYSNFVSKTFYNIWTLVLLKRAWLSYEFCPVHPFICPYVTLFSHDWLTVIIIIIIIIIITIIIALYWGSSWGSREIFLPKMPYYAKMGASPMKTVEWPSHLCEIRSQCVSTTSHTQFRWFCMFKGWCIAPA